MKHKYCHCAAITLVLSTACGSNEVESGRHADASQGGAGAGTGGTHTSGAIGGSRSMAVGGSGPLVASGSDNPGGGAGVTPIFGGTSSLSNAGGSSATATANGGITSIPPATGGSVSVATGGSVSVSVGGTLGVAAGGSSASAKGGVSGVGGSSVALCTPGELASCPTGLLGACALGQKKCNANGTAWSNCIQLQAQARADCNSTIDNDCDGHPDNTEFNDYRIDADQDKYCTAGTLSHVCKGSQPTNAILASACLGTDCDDTSYFRSVSCAKCVTGLAVTDVNTAPSTGFEKIDVNLNEGVGGHQVWLWKRMVADAPCLTDIELAYTADWSTMPFDSTWTVSPVDLNEEVAADKIIRVGWKVDPNGTSILDVNVISGYTKLSNAVYSTTSGTTWYIAQWTSGSVDNWGHALTGNADANKNVDGPYIYILYQK